MKKSAFVSLRRSGMVALAALAIAAVSPEAMAQSAKLSAKARNLDSIMSDVQAKGKAHVIVEFSVPAADITSDAGLAARKAAVRAGQDAILASHFGSRAAERGVSRMRIRPLFAVAVDAAELERLAADSRVTTIYYNQIAKPTLIQSVPLIGGKVLKRRGGDGSEFAVAVLDTGVQKTHDFLKNHVIAEACFSNAGGGGGGTSTCPNGQNQQIGNGAGVNCNVAVDSDCTHGTHVAGIAAGKLTNKAAHPGAPKNGVAPRAKIIAIQVFTFTSGGLGAFFSDIELGLEFVFDNRASFSAKPAATNMSLGGGGSNASNCDASNPLTGIINDLRGVKIASAIASGNNGFTGGVTSPGCVSTAITVGSSDKSDNISSFSNMGALVDVMAPGSSIQSSVVNNSFAFFNGTSMATPHVAGTWAAIRTLHPSASVTQIENALESTGVDIDDTRPGGTFTKPRIQIDDAESAL